MIFWVFYESNNGLEIFTDGGKRIRKHVRQSTLKICMRPVAEFTHYSNQVNEKDEQLRSFICLLLIMIQTHRYTTSLLLSAVCSNNRIVQTVEPNSVKEAQFT